MPQVHPYIDKNTWKFYDDIAKELGVATTNVIRAALRLGTELSPEKIKEEVLMFPTYVRREKVEE